MRSLLDAGGVLVLSGAGLSTESGIPDYRGPTSVRRTPMTFQDFTGTAEARQRYWARAHLGWRVIGSARPNAGHRAVTAFQEAGLLHGIITQNVDGLHQAAGAQDVLELHGSLGWVVCLGCGARVPRDEHSRRLAEANPGFAPAARPLPDGDVDLSDVSGFQVVDCSSCGGILKPDVVFFGENVPAPTVARAFALTDSCTSLLVLGSSLTVRSGYRFVLRASQRGVPIAIINQGPTRADDLAIVRIDAPLGQTLTGLLQERVMA
ncbi:MAG: NAD-dependent deacetylase [Frankiales bacterium]|nr:NAD-dependent deacetylase [Frankiales bacterium]